MCLPALIILKAVTCLDAVASDQTLGQLEGLRQMISTHRLDSLPDLLKSEVNFAAGMLASMNSFLVLLQAATDPAPNGEMKVAGFDPSLVRVDNGILVGGPLVLGDKMIDLAGPVTAASFEDSLDDCVKCLKKQQPEIAQLQGSFDVKAVLKDCAAYNPQDPPVFIRLEYRDEALLLAGQILRLVDLQDILARPWGDFQKWITEMEAENKNLGTEMSAALQSPGASQNHLHLAKIYAMLKYCCQFAEEAISRTHRENSNYPANYPPMDMANWLVKYIPQAPPNWKNLQFALTAAAAGMLFRQYRQAVNLAWAVLN